VLLASSSTAGDDSSLPAQQLQLLPPRLPLHASAVVAFGGDNNTSQGALVRDILQAEQQLQVRRQ
jgi:hypothetical protein